MSADVCGLLLFKPAVHRFQQVQLSESIELTRTPGVPRAYIFCQLMVL